MTNTAVKTVIFSLTGLLCASSVFAQMHHRSPMHCDPSMAVSRIAGQNESMERILALKPHQKEAFNQYAAEREKVMKERQGWREMMMKRYPVDYQMRLEHRAEIASKAADHFKRLATSRNAFLKTLDAQQRLVLETLETKRGYGMIGHHPHKKGKPAHMDGKPMIKHGPGPKHEFHSGQKPLPPKVKPAS